MTSKKNTVTTDVKPSGNAKNAGESHEETTGFTFKEGEQSLVISVAQNAANNIAPGLLEYDAAKILTEFIDEYDDTPPEAVFRKAVEINAIDAEANSWAEINPIMRAAIEIFIATYERLNVAVHEMNAIIQTGDEAPLPAHEYMSAAETGLQIER